jgi:hypothetical protein
MGNKNLSGDRLILDKIYGGLSLLRVGCGSLMTEMTGKNCEAGTELNYRGGSYERRAELL